MQKAKGEAIDGLAKVTARGQEAFNKALDGLQKITTSMSKAFNEAVEVRDKLAAGLPNARIARLQKWAEIFRPVFEQYPPPDSVRNEVRAVANVTLPTQAGAAG